MSRGALELSFGHKSIHFYDFLLGCKEVLEIGLTLPDVVVQMPILSMVDYR